MGDLFALPQLTKPLHPAEVFRWLTLGLVVGFGLSVFVWLPWYISLSVSLVVAVLAYFQSSLRVVSLVAIGSLFALARASFLPVPPAADVFVGPQFFTATIVAAPTTSDKSTRYIVQPQDVYSQPVVLLTRPNDWYHYGERLQVSCQKMEVVDFVGYTNQGLFRECAFPQLKFLSPAPFSIKGSLLKLRQSAGTYLSQLVAPPYASLAAGMLWGDYTRLPQPIIDAFRRTGTSHLLAVSGYNVMVLSEILFTVLIAVGLWRRQASWVVMGALILFTLFAGAEASVVRAAIMASLLVVARLLKRRPDRVNVLLGTAAAMLLFEPRLITDLGFQLSFGAMAGLMFLSAPLEGKFTFLPELWGLRQSVAQTMAATAATLPIILFRLNQLSLVSPFANVLVGPVVVLVFTFGLPLVVLGAFTWLALPFAWLLTAVLAYVITVVESLGDLTWAWTQGSTVAWAAAALLYGATAWWLLRSAKPKKSSGHRLA